MSVESLDTALIAACKYGRAEVAEYLLFRGLANVDAQNKLGETALIAVAGNPLRLPIVRLLLDDNANTEIQDENGLTALMRAAKAGLRDTVEMLRLRRGREGLRQVASQSAAGCHHAAEGGSRGTCCYERVHGKRCCACVKPGPCALPLTQQPVERCGSTCCLRVAAHANTATNSCRC